MERTITITLERAREWFKTTGLLKELALTAFTIDELDPKLNWDYDKILEKFAKKYPIGTVVWSNDGTDVLPNVIVSKPYLESRTSLYNIDNITKSIIFDTMRIGLTDVWHSRIKIYEKEDFQKIQISSYNHKDDFDYNKWKAARIELNNNRIKSRIESIEKCEATIKSYNQDVIDDTYENEHFDELYDKCYSKIMSEIKNKA